MKKTEMQNPMIGVSLPSYLPSLLNPERAARRLKDMGYQFMQVGPTRGIPADRTTSAFVSNLNDILPIQLIEDVWCEKPEDWGLLDRIMFGSPGDAWARYETLILLKTYCRSHPDPVSHEFGKESLVELHPGLWLTPDQIRLELVANPLIRLVIDTYHLRRRHFYPNQLKFKPPHIDPTQMLEAWLPWREYMKPLAKYVEWVHVQPHREAGEQDKWLHEWVHGQRTELSEMLWWLRDNCPNIRGYVVELAPPNGVLPKAMWLATINQRFEQAYHRLRSDFLYS